ncbi:helix-turn-helix domain-containing protein [Pelagovum pacificum]|uniref:Helix-turn-helix transcriptional regulator n=1 Tax=Pelagovum pacificum TaxID=2588711 RepID=A0A5C5GFG2_9RHOB|nr:helix-turn-helix transcriptional regulator [Pelagovum pacificum]TNY32934.1 helix-turn-helix transcriptional regulator [Pelagovum pacificum]
MSSLAAYRKRTGLSQRALAEALGRDQSIISRLEGGSLMPTISFAFEIERFTQGEVPASSWVPADPKARAAS